MTFVEKEGQTKLTVNIQLPSAQDLRATMDMGMMEGLKETINNLGKHLGEIQ